MSDVLLLYIFVILALYQYTCILRCYILIILFFIISFTNQSFYIILDEAKKAKKNTKESKSSNNQEEMDKIKPGDKSDDQETTKTKIGEESVETGKVGLSFSFSIIESYRLCAQYKLILH